MGTATHGNSGLNLPRGHLDLNDFVLHLADNIGERTILAEGHVMWSLDDGKPSDKPSSFCLEY